MIQNNFEYKKPKSLEEMFEFLKQEGATLLAGGTDVMVVLRDEKINPSLLVDIKGISELNGIKETEEGVWIGAATPVQKIAENPITQKYRALSEGAGAIACYELRLRATIGGNICNGSPSADSVPGLLLYDAKVEIGSYDGGAVQKRTMQLSDFILEGGKVDLKKGEALLGIILPKIKQGAESRYRRITRVKGMDLSGVSVSVYCEGKENIKIALGAAYKKVARAYSAEEHLKGKPLTKELLNEALGIMQKDINPRKSSLRATPEYKKLMINELIIAELEEMTGGAF